MVTWRERPSEDLPLFTNAHKLLLDNPPLLSECLESMQRAKLPRLTACLKPPQLSWQLTRSGDQTSADTKQGILFPSSQEQPRGAHREGAQGQDAVAGELRAGQIQIVQLRQTGQEQRCAVGDARVLRERQVLQSSQPDELFDSLVADAAAADLQPLQSPERPEQAHRDSQAHMLHSCM